MSTETAFIRAIERDDKEVAIAEAIVALASARTLDGALFLSDPSNWRVVPGNPFAYWATDEVLSKFAELEPLESETRSAKFGASTKDDSRWLRAWWEVPARSLSAGNRPTSIETKQHLQLGRLSQPRWVAHAKGGAWSEYFAPLHLVIDWQEGGVHLKEFVASWRAEHGWSPHWRAELKNSESYFRAGVTWPRRSGRLSFRALPSGSIIGDKGPGIFVQGDGSGDLYVMLGVLNSEVFGRLIAIMVGRVELAQSFEVGLVQQAPFPVIEWKEGNLIQNEVDGLCEIVRSRFVHSEEVREFLLPGAIHYHSTTLQEAIGRAMDEAARREVAFKVAQDRVERIVGDCYGFTSSNDVTAQMNDSDVSTDIGVDEVVDDDESGGDPFAEPDDLGGFVDALLSFVVGCVVGRWDIRSAVTPHLLPRLQGPFDPLPVCSPSMLVGPDGLPACSGGIVSEEWLRARPDIISRPPEDSVARPTIPDEEYPVRIDWDGILADDEGHPDDVVVRARDVLAILWEERAAAIEDEAVQILGVRSLREWFRNPRHFWAFHIKRYSKSRRKAPIYWLLQSKKRHYGLWLYYPRIDADTLHKALAYANERVTREEGRLAEAHAAARAAEGRPKREAEKRAEAHEEVLADVAAFRDELRRAADQGLVPDHDDGVLLSIAPLHSLVPWPDAKRVWAELVAGKYEWSSMGRQMRERGLVSEGGGGRGR